jgi:hypothetical protein
MTRFASQVKPDYTGAYVTKRFADYEQPQDFVMAKRDPEPVPYNNPPVQPSLCAAYFPYFIGNTNIVASTNGPAEHLFEPGVGEMKVGCSFIVR